MLCIVSKVTGCDNVYFNVVLGLSELKLYYGTTGGMSCELNEAIEKDYARKLFANITAICFFEFYCSRSRYLRWLLKTDNGNNTTRSQGS